MSASIDKMVADFLDDELNMKNFVLSLIDRGTYEVNLPDSIGHFLKLFFCHDDFRIPSSKLKNRFKRMVYLVKFRYRFCVTVTSFIYKHPLFISYKQNYMENKKYKIEIIANTNVCKNYVKFDVSGLKFFINESNIKEFICYAIECDFKYFSKCKKLFGLFDLFMCLGSPPHFYHRDNLFKIMVEMMLNIETFKKRVSFGFHSNYYLELYEQYVFPYTNLNEFLHDCLCEYKPYNDYAMNYSERKERLCYLHENVYNNFLKNQRTSDIYLILSDEYLIHLLCKFI